MRNLISVEHIFWIVRFWIINGNSGIKLIETITMIYINYIIPDIKTGQVQKNDPSCLTDRVYIVTLWRHFIIIITRVVIVYRLRTYL